jgi:hypothetical protein
MAEDENRMAKMIQSLDRSSNTSIRKYPQPPSAPNRKVPERGSHDQGGKFPNFTIRGGKGVRGCGSIWDPNKPEWGDARIVDESILDQEIECPIRISFSLADRPLRCTITDHLLSITSNDPFDEAFRPKEISEEFFPLLFVNLNMAISMGGDLMPFPVDHLHNLRRPLCNIPENKEGGFDFKTAEKDEDPFDIDQDSTLTSIPRRTGENVFDITDVIPIFHIHCENIPWDLQDHWSPLSSLLPDINSRLQTPMKMSNVKAQMANQVQSSNVKNFLDFGL